MRLALWILIVLAFSACRGCRSGVSHDGRDVADAAGFDMAPRDVEMSDQRMSADTWQVDTAGDADTEREIVCTGTEEEELIAWFEENQKCDEPSDCIRVISWMPPPHHAYPTCETGVNESADLDEYEWLQLRYSRCTDHPTGCLTYPGEPKGPIDCRAGYCY